MNTVSLFTFLCVSFIFRLWSLQLPLLRRPNQVLMKRKGPLLLQEGPSLNLNRLPGLSSNLKGDLVMLDLECKVVAAELSCPKERLGKFIF